MLINAVGGKQTEVLLSVNGVNLLFLPFLLKITAVAPTTGTNEKGIDISVTKSAEQEQLCLAIPYFHTTHAENRAYFDLSSASLAYGQMAKNSCRSCFECWFHLKAHALDLGFLSCWHTR